VFHLWFHPWQVFSAMTLSLTTFIIKGLYGTLTIGNTRYNNALSLFYAKCHVVFFIMQNIIILSVVMLNLIMLSVVMLSVDMLNVIMLSVVMLSVVEPFSAKPILGGSY
jgi:hypothetical protein